MSRAVSLDRWERRYAARAQGMVASEVRALFAVASRPEIVSLAGGMPDVAALPMDVMAATMSDLVAGQGPTALQYGSAQGDPGLREALCAVMAMEGITAEPDNVVVTVGSQQALDLLARIFVDPGDVVLTESPTYVTAIATFRACQADLVSVAMDDDGLIPQALSDTIGRLTAAGRCPKLLYTVPTFQNPAGVTLAAERRGAVVEICQRAGVLIVEDNPYGLLGFEGGPMRPLRADAPEDAVVYLGSMSKTLAPGLRVGWALAPPAVKDKLVLAAESAMLSHSVFAQLVVQRYLSTQPWADQLKGLRVMYRARRDAMLDALAVAMPAGATWTRPAGGFFVWVTLPDGVDARAMLPRAIAARVAYVPGIGFHPDGQGANTMRLSYCFPSPDRVTEGVNRLGRVLRRELSLLDTFGRPVSPA